MNAPTCRRSRSVLIVDDSPFVRSTVRRLLEEDPAFCVVGAVSNGEEALAAVARLEPDLVTLDLEMPVMDGMTVLARLLQEHRQRVLVLSSHAAAGSYPTFKALALGAVDFVCKPGVGGYLHSRQEFGRTLREKLSRMAGVPRARIGRSPDGASKPPPALMASDEPSSASDRVEHLVGVGSSTGGTHAIEILLATLPQRLPAAVLVVQHLPEGFAEGLAAYLTDQVGCDVRTATDGETLRAGQVRLAPGHGHLRVQRVDGEYRLRIDTDGPQICGFRPAIDALFYSLALAAAERSRGVVLSGMGSDGANGLAAIRRRAGRTFAQDFASCVVPEMPMRAFERGGVEQVAPVATIAAALAETIATPWGHHAVS
jgi:two-component system, chemotaxis family, protein-glutamate methylesterase/glutaminase